jgi:hypothetical protein
VKIISEGKGGRGEGGKGKREKGKRGNEEWIMGHE